MRLTLRSKLTAIVGTAGLAFVVLLVTSAFIERRIDRELTEIREQYVPRLELGPKLQHGFERLTRDIQDAAAAQDTEALAATRAQKDQLVAALSDERWPLESKEAARTVREALEAYYAAAADVARRLIANEGGEDMVQAVSDMQAKQVRASQAIVRATAFDEGEIRRAFGSAARAQTIAVRARIAIIVLCMFAVVALAYWITRSVLRSLAELDRGLQRFAQGRFDRPIEVSARDELGLLGEQANRMAESLQRLNEERDRADWLKEGLAGLSRELRGELEPHEVAARATRYLAGYLEAPLGIFYGADESGALQLLGHYGFDASAATPPSFEVGQGLVGQAASEHAVRVIAPLPGSFLRVRTGLGEGDPQAIALLPLARLGRVVGVIELAVLKPWTEAQTALLHAVQETVAIALEVARARAALRELLAQTQRQAERLAAQEEELRASNDELRAQQEELEAQQEELREANEGLTTQSKELLAQQRALEQKNAQLAEARQRLQEKADELASVSAYKSQFLANMSHELRTPLNSMLLLSNLLAQNEGKNLTPRQVEFCKTIHGAGQDLLALINQVLDLAKIESGKQEASFEPVALRDLAERAERIFGPLARDKGLLLSVEVTASAPERITTDKRRLDQILTNLMGNAIKFTERGSVALRIGRLSTQAALGRPDLDPERTVEFAVEDTGIGIDEAHRESVFAPFEQVDGRPDRRYGGTGLGLAIARELSTLLGGELHLRSVRGQGSTFTCYLPCEPPAALEPAPEPEGQAHAAGARASAVYAVPDDRAALDGAEPYLLVIEDDPVFAEVVGEVIHSQGLKYIAAADGGAALQLARERKPCGVVLDVKLPDVDGFEVMKALREDPETAEVPVHFVSALDAGERGMALGAVGYLTKPASRADIRRAIQALAPKALNAPYRVLIVEDDGAVSESLEHKLAGDDIETERATSASEALERLAQSEYGCVVLDLSLPDMDGLELLRALHERGDKPPPVVVYTGRALSKAETQRLEAYTDAIVLKDGPSAERVLHEVRLFAHRLRAGLPPTRRPGPTKPPPIPLRLEGRRLLLVDDDMRTVYALSAVLRAKGAEVLMADTGKVALELLAEQPQIDAVLMDIMMPEMDGYEAIRRIRADARFKELPIVALTAKAMKGDRERCLEAGATDYLPKPVEPEALTTMLRNLLVETAAQ